MKFSFSIYTLLASHVKAITEVAQVGEEAGFHALYTPDHLIAPIEVPHTYPYSPTGEPPLQADTPLYDAWALLSYIAGVTSRIRLGTSVFILPLRDPIATARSVMTVDVLSKGRAVFGIGVGWLAPEFEIAGRDFRNRGPITDETVAVLRELWTKKVIDFKGEHMAYGPVNFEPKVAQPGGVPIIVGGVSEPALRRAARLGDGWMGMAGTDFALMKKRIARLHELRREYGRENEPFTIAVSSGQHDLDTVHRFAEAGVDQMNIAPQPLREKSTPEKFKDGLKRLGEEIVAKSP